MNIYKKFYMGEHFPSAESLELIPSYKYYITEWERYLKIVNIDF